jgi:hypothetical protein
MYLDAMTDRVEEQTADAFDSAVASVRVGYVIARDRRAAQRWDRRVARRQRRSAGLSGASLEAAIMGLAATHPEYVVVG